MTQVTLDDDNETTDTPVVDIKFLNLKVETQSTDPFEADATKHVGHTPTFKRSLTRKMNKAFGGGADGAKSQSEVISALTGYESYDIIHPPYNMNYLARLYEISVPHGAAVRAKAINVVGLGYELLDNDATVESFNALTDARKAKVRPKINAARRAARKKLESFNDDDSFEQTLMKVYIDYATTGNGFIEVGRGASGKIGYVGHIPATTMRVRRKEDGYVQLVSNRARFFRRFGDLETPDPFGGDLQPNEIIHIKTYSPTNTYYGVPEIIAAMGAIAGDEFAQKYNLDYFENKAVPRYVVTLKGARLSAQAEAALLEFFETKLKGKNHRSIFIPLPPDMAESKVEFKMEPIEVGQQEASFTDYRDKNRDYILMASRTPLNKVGYAIGNLAAAIDADRSYKEQVCRPEQGIFETRIQKIVDEFTDAFYFNFNEMTLTDEDIQSQIAQRLVAGQIATQNEGREMVKLPARADGDKYVELKPQQGSEMAAQAGQTRTRDGQRTANASDGKGQARAPKGEGRQQA